jgi:hypothetical protein
MSGGIRPQRRLLRFPAVRFRAKIILGFVVVLAISAASLGIAYLGFEHIASAVASYRNSVSEADLARNTDRELISYRALAKYYVVTSKEDDAKAALSARTSLRLARAIGQLGVSRRKPLQPFVASLRADPVPAAQLPPVYTLLLCEPDKLSSLVHDRHLAPRHQRPPSQAESCRYDVSTMSPNDRQLCPRAKHFARNDGAGDADLT